MAAKKLAFLGAVIAGVVALGSPAFATSPGQISVTTGHARGQAYYTHGPVGTSGSLQICKRIVDSDVVHFQLQMKADGGSSLVNVGSAYAWNDINTCPIHSGLGGGGPLDQFRIKSWETFSNGSTISGSTAYSNVMTVS